MTEQVEGSVDGLQQERNMNRDTITELQDELRGIYLRASAITQELTVRWDHDRELGITIGHRPIDQVEAANEVIVDNRSSESD